MPTDNSPAVLFQPRSDGKRLVDVFEGLCPYPLYISGRGPLALRLDGAKFSETYGPGVAIEAILRVAAEDVLRKAWPVLEKKAQDLLLSPIRNPDAPWCPTMNARAAALSLVIRDINVALIHGADWPTLAALLWRVAEVEQ